MGVRSDSGILELPAKAKRLTMPSKKHLATCAKFGDLCPAVVLEASRAKVVVQRANGERIAITGQGGWTLPAPD